MKLTQKAFEEKKLIILNKINKYKSQLSRQLSYIHKIPRNNFIWSTILDSWLFHVLSIIVINFEKNKKKKIFIKDNLNYDYVINHSIELFEKEKINYISSLVDNQFNKNNNIKSDFKFVEKRKNIFYLNNLLNFFIRLFIFIRKPILITDAYFCFKDRIKFFLISYGKILILSSGAAFNDNIKSKVTQNELRTTIKVKEQDNIDKVFNILLKNTLPKNYLENFEEYLNESNFYFKNLKILGSAINIHTSDFYKILASRMLSNRKQVLGFQHGYGYNFTNNNITEKIEKRNCSKYFYWNDRKGLGLNYLNRFKKLKKINYFKNKKIYFLPDTLETEFYYFDYFLLYRDFNVKKRKQNHLELCNNIKQKKLLNIKCFRKEEKDYDYLKKKGYKLVINKRIDKILSETKLLISDVFCTAAVEALYSNTPMILILKHDLNKYGFKKNIKDIFVSLKKFGFIHKDFKTAGKFLSKNYDNLEKYWYQKKLQVTLKKLKKYNYSDNPNFLSEFNNFLKNYKTN